MADTLRYIVFGTDDPSYVPVLTDNNEFTGTNTFQEDIILDSDSYSLILGEDQDVEITGTGAGAMMIAPSAADTDMAITFYGTTHSGILTWMEDEDYFAFGDDVSLGTNDLSLTGSIASTGSRVTKGWFVDIEVTNMPTVGGVSIEGTFVNISGDTMTGTLNMDDDTIGVCFGADQDVTIYSDTADELSIKGSGLTAADIKIVFESGNEGSITWMEDEKRFDIDSNSDASCVRLLGVDGANDYTDMYVNSDGQLFIVPVSRTVWIGDGTDGDSQLGFYGDTSVYTLYHDEDNGNLKVSANDATNYTQFASDGIMTMAGTARVYRNLFIRASALGVGGANPASETVNGSGFEIVEFADAADDYAQVNINVPSDMDVSADCEIRITWSVPNTSANMTWGYGYSVVGENEDTEAAATTGSTVVTSSGTADGKTSDTLVTIAGGTLAQGDLLQLYFYRDVSEDTYGNPVDVHGVALKYVSNKLGAAL